MTGSSSFWFANPGSNFFNGVAEQSARFNSGSSSYLYFTPSGNGDRRKATIAFWFKKTTNGDSHSTLFSINDSSSGNYMTIIFLTDQMYLQTAPSADYLLTNQVFRDTTAWYHLCWSIDTTQSTASDRVKVYLNGTQITDWSTAQYPDQDSYLDICSTQAHAWGYFYDYGRYFSGYIADAYIIDGQQLTPSSFTETKEGAIIPKAYTGSFGTNGVHLEFKQTGTGTASTSTIGADTSGNTHHYTSSGMGSDDSNIPDSPENNFCTFNPLQPLGASAGVCTLTEGNLKATNGSSAYHQAMGDLSVKTGKWYIEYYINGAGFPSWEVGWTRSNRFETWDGSSQAGLSFLAYMGYFTGSNVWFSTFGSTSIASPSVAYSGLHDAADAPTTGDVIQCAVDFDAGKMWFGINGQYVDVGSGHGVPASGSNPSLTWTASTYADEFKTPHINNYTGTFTLNCGQDSTFAGAISAGGNKDGNDVGDFKYAVPSGFLALCTANLSEPTIGPNSDDQADDHFDIVTYTGNDSTNNITFNMSPDLVWLAMRGSTGGGYGKSMWDSTRGDDKYLYSSGNNAEATGTDYVAFQTNGIQIDVSWDGINHSGENYIAWGWKAGGGTTSSNGNGSITSTVQANTTAGFSIITYTGDENGGTIGHGLSQKPDFIMFKSRDTSDDWGVYHSYIGASNSISLNSSSGLYGYTLFSNTEPTSSVITLGASSSVGRYRNNKSSTNYVAYCWHSVSGYSKFGGYEGYASTNGAYVHLGFRPRLVAIKNLDSAGSWVVFDSERHPDNIIDIHTMWETTAGEGTDDDIDFLSNGFKARRSTTTFNSAHTFVYMAWAEMPEKYSLAR